MGTIPAGSFHSRLGKSNSSVKIDRRNASQCVCTRKEKYCRRVEKVEITMREKRRDSRGENVRVHERKMAEFTANVTPRRSITAPPPIFPIIFLNKNKKGKKRKKKKWSKRRRRSESMEEEKIIKFNGYPKRGRGGKINDHRRRRWRQRRRLRSWRSDNTQPKSRIPSSYVTHRASNSSAACITVSKHVNGLNSECLYSISHIYGKC